MPSKVERERAALLEAENELKERRKRLAELEREEEQNALDRLVKKIGRSRAIEILELCASMKPKEAIIRLTQGAEGAKRKDAGEAREASPELDQSGAATEAA